MALAKLPCKGGTRIRGRGRRGPREAHGGANLAEENSGAQTQHADALVLAHHGGNVAHGLFGAPDADEGFGEDQAHGGGRGRGLQCVLREDQGVTVLALPQLLLGRLDSGLELVDLLDVIAHRLVPRVTDQGLGQEGPGSRHVALRGTGRGRSHHYRGGPGRGGPGGVAQCGGRAPGTQMPCRRAGKPW